MRSFVFLCKSNGPSGRWRAAESEVCHSHVPLMAAAFARLPRATLPMSGEAYCTWLGWLCILVTRTQLLCFLYSVCAEGYRHV